MERNALTNGNQRRSTVAVALASGMTVAQYVELINTYAQYEVAFLGNTAELRRSNARHLVREGFITGRNVTTCVRNARTYPRATS